MAESKIATCTNVTITSTDGWPLAAICLTPPTSPKGVLMVCSGTGIRKEFYLKFGTWLSSHGYIIVLFDYRGIGGSKSDAFTHCELSMTAWGKLDMTSVLKWINTHYTGFPTYLIGHSIGGQLIGLLPNNNTLDGVLAIGASTGNWRHMATVRKYVAAFMMHVYLPFTARFFNYIPLRIIGFGEDLPRKVAQEWAMWCRDKQYFKKWLLDGAQGNTSQHYFHQLTCFYFHLSFDDDYIATDRTIGDLIACYPKAIKKVVRYAPKYFKKKAVGHVEFFRSSHQELWPLVLQPLESVIQPDTVSNETNSQ
ncbi:MAG TPA: alpha/beta fold hydrolase [Flavisolibacter sp.]|nr:alpha/beta fold hydrolase [Flavisolibacter sp.]